ncbi:V-type ATPase 116 kDa subunit [Thermotoga sp. Mc24]|uniref:V-type ATP synthase subunit I n=1 Tax=Thermotoga sp. Mc24 TaxID=1231241 RepID=UPI000541B5BB|nr:V-type ATPase 116kDa subunit family protein [Thermotoga sp. Mc24]KHC92357.1 V-type ATPase 116 kDa subunit [Thermotoga sp. Mc24]
MQEKLSAFSIIAPVDESERLLKRILDTESVEMIPLESIFEEETLNLLRTPDHTFYDDIYSKFMNLYEMIGETPSPEPQNVDISKMNISLKDVNAFIEKVLPVVETLHRKMNDLKQEREKKTKDLEIVERLRMIDVNLKDLRESEFFRYHFGNIGNDYVERLKESVKDEDVLILEVAVEEEKTWLFVIHRKELDLESTLTTAGFVEYSLSESYSGTPSEISLQLEDELKVLDSEIEILNSTIRREFYKNRRLVKNYFEYIYILKNIHDLLQKTKSTENFLVISGWTTHQNLEEMKRFLESNPRMVLLSCQPNTKPPTLLKNRGFFKHFESITRMFGIPSSDEIDPTPFVAIMFLAFFGMMFGDVGHGLVLALFGFGLYWRLKNDLLYVIGSAGVSSSIFGMLYGSVFGYEIIPSIWKRPMENINYFLAFSIYIGIATITFAMILNIVNNLKNREKRELLFNHNGILGLLFYWIAVVSVLIFFMNGSFPRFGLISMGVLVGVMYVYSFIFTEAPLSERIVQAFFEVFEILISYFSNTLSFVRLGAFALNHAGLFLAFYTMAKMAKNPVVTFVILFLGNIIIIGLEGLVVFIQTLRLEFYEFFTRFFKDSGREFNPERYKL